MKVSFDNINTIVDLYLNYKKNIYDIAKDLHLSTTTVALYLKKQGIKLSPQKYKFNENYFNDIDTPNKAYFLGLLYADGCITNNKNSCYIKLKESDRYIIEKFKEEIDSQKPLYYRKSEIVKGTDYVGKAQYKLELNSQLLIKDLYKWGVTQNKSLSIQFPTNISYMRDFIRGFFDGDGCIYNSQNRIMLNFVSNEFFLQGFNKFLQEELDIFTKCKKDNRSNSWYMFIAKIKDVLKFCEYIYQDENCIKLERKYKKYKDYLKEKGII